MHSYKSLSDQTLLELLRENDALACSELYERYANLVLDNVYSRTHSADVAQEVLQNIFTDLWERRRSLEIATFSHYIVVSVKYQVIAHIRREIAFRKHSDVYKTFVRVSEEGTLNDVRFNDLEQALRNGVQRLPEKTQLVFRLNRFEGKSIEEISKNLNLSEKAIKYHISRSLKELRLYLKEFLLSLMIWIGSY